MHTLRFPLAMLPLVNIRKRFSRWYRHWRNDVVGSGGYLVMKAWKRQFDAGPFRRKLQAAAEKLAAGRAASAKATADQAATR